jgi:hypothetical protein
MLSEKTKVVNNKKASIITPTVFDFYRCKYCGSIDYFTKMNRKLINDRKNSEKDFPEKILYYGRTYLIFGNKK